MTQPSTKAITKHMNTHNSFRMHQSIWRNEEKKQKHCLYDITFNALLTSSLLFVKLNEIMF